MIPIVLIVSFLLDSIVSNFISINSLLNPLFTIMALIIVFPYFISHKSKKNYLITCFVTGICYDLIYTDTLVLHGFLFLLIGYIIGKLNLVLSNNYVNVAIMGLIVIIVYRLVMYAFLLVTANISFDIFTVIKSIYSSLILNMLYVSLVFLITNKISDKLKIRRAN